MTLPTKDQFLASLEPDIRPPSPASDCAICQGDPQAPTTTECGHTFCLLGLIIWMERTNTCPLCRAQLYREPASNPADFRITGQPVSGAQVGLMAFGGNDSSNEILQIVNTYIVHGCIEPDYHARSYVAFDQAFMNHKLAALIWTRPSQTAYGNLCAHEWHLVSESVNQTVHRLHDQTPTALQLFMELDSHARSALGHRFPDYGVVVGTPHDRRTFRDDMYDFIRAIVRFAQLSYEIKAERGDFGEQGHDSSASNRL